MGSNSRRNLRPSLDRTVGLSLNFYLDLLRVNGTLWSVGWREYDEVNVSGKSRVATGACAAEVDCSASKEITSVSCLLQYVRSSTNDLQNLVTAERFDKTWALVKGGTNRNR